MPWLTSRGIVFLFLLVCVFSMPIKFDNSYGSGGELVPGISDPGSCLLECGERPEECYGLDWDWNSLQCYFHDSTKECLPLRSRAGVVHYRFTDCTNIQPTGGATAGPTTTAAPAITPAPTPATPTPSASGPELSNAVQYTDVHIAGGTAIPTASSIDDCLAVCHYSRSCQGFDWNYVRQECTIHTYLTECDALQNKPGTNHFRLKANCDPVLATCFNVVFQDYSDASRDGGLVVLAGQGFAQCQTLCRVTDVCQAVTYVHDTQQCRMHTTTGLPKPDSCCVHSRKLCDDPTTPVGPTTRPITPAPPMPSTAPPAVSTSPAPIDDNGKCPSQLQSFPDTRSLDGVAVPDVNDTDACKAWCLANATCAAVDFDLTTDDVIKCYWHSNETYDPDSTLQDDCCVQYRKLTESRSHAGNQTLHDNENNPCIIINITTEVTTEVTTGDNSHINTWTPQSGSRVSPNASSAGWAESEMTTVDPGIRTNEANPRHIEGSGDNEARTAEQDDFLTESKTGDFEEDDVINSAAKSVSRLRSDHLPDGTLHPPALADLIRLDFENNALDISEDSEESEESEESEDIEDSDHIALDIETNMKPSQNVFIANTPIQTEKMVLYESTSIPVVTTTRRHGPGQTKRCWSMAQTVVTDDLGSGVYAPIEELLSVSSNTTDTYPDVTLEECDGLCAVSAAFTMDAISGAFSSSGPAEAERYCYTGDEAEDVMALGRFCRMDVLGEDDDVKNVSMLCYCQTDACNAFWVQMLQATIAHYPLDCNTLDLSFAGRHGEDVSMAYSGVDQAKNWSAVFNGSNYIEVRAFMNLLLGQIGPSPNYYITPNFTIFFWFKFTAILNEPMTMVSNGPRGQASLDVYTTYVNSTHRRVSAGVKIKGQQYTGTVMAPINEWKYFAARIVPDDLTESLQLSISIGDVTGENDYDVIDTNIATTETGIRLDPTGNKLSIGRQSPPLFGGSSNAQEEYYVGMMDELWFIARGLSDFELAALAESSYYPQRLDTS